jgi:hypothetical protein
MIPHDTHLQIGSMLFEGLDQIDLTGPFEALSRIPNSTYRLYGKTAEPVRDLKGLRLTPDAALADAPQLDVLHVPGGFGQEPLMEEAEVLAWIRQQAADARSVFSVCAAELRGDEAAQAIQLDMVYAPEPPFNSGTPETASRDTGTGTAIRAGHYRTARADGAAHRWQTRHRHSGRVRRSMTLLVGSALAGTEGVLARPPTATLLNRSQRDESRHPPR